jgi:hypothetical protein
MSLQQYQRHRHASLVELIFSCAHLKMCPHHMTFLLQKLKNPMHMKKEVRDQSCLQFRIAIS